MRHGCAHAMDMHLASVTMPSPSLCPALVEGVRSAVCNTAYGGPVGLQGLHMDMLCFALGTLQECSHPLAVAH